MSRQSGIGLHLTRARTYELNGRLVFSDHSAPVPWPKAIYSQDLVVLRSHHSYLADRSKFEALMMKRGTHVEVNVGETVHKKLDISTTTDLIETALQSLRSPHP